MQRTAVGVFIALAAALPASALAAGFAKASLFLSQSSAYAGEEVHVYAPVQNQSEEPFSGSVVFAEEGKAVGTVPVSLSGGEARIVSVLWIPSAEGTRKLTATLEKKDGSSVDSLSGSFAVLKPKIVPAQQQAAVESSRGIQDNIQKISPAVESYVAPAFTIIDSVRNAAADVLDGQLEKTKQGLGPNGTTPGEVFGADVTRNAAKDPVSTLMYFLKVLYFYALTLLRFTIGSAALFYPLFAIVFLWALWKMFRRFRRPAY